MGERSEVRDDLYRESERDIRDEIERRRTLPREQVTQDRPTEYIPVDRGPEVVASSLAPQLGSDSATLAHGAVDMRRFSIISQEDIPFLLYALVRGRKSRIWKDIRDEYLNLQVGVDGRGRRDIIRMEGVSKGGMPEMEPEFGRQSWLQRNITNRGGQKRAVRDQM